MCRVAYSRTEETRELAMTKVADITASYARCKLLKDSHGLWRPLTSEDKWQLTHHRPRSSARVEMVAGTVSDK
jgi:hypothetical protein